MTEGTARALARRLRREGDGAIAAGIRAAMEAGGFDPDTTEPDEPEGYIERALSAGRANNPGYLTWAELNAQIEAIEAALGGLPF